MVFDKYYIDTNYRMATFNAAKVRGLTRRNSFSSSTTPYIPSAESIELESKTPERPIISPDPHIIHGNINQIPITKIINISSSGIISPDILKFKMNTQINSIITIKYSLIITFDNDALTAPSTQTRSLLMKSVAEYIFMFNTSGTGSWVNGNNSNTFLNPVNGTRNILNPLLSTSVDSDTGIIRITMNMIGVGQLYINGTIDVVSNNSEAIINFS